MPTAEKLAYAATYCCGMGEITDKIKNLLQKRLDAGETLGSLERETGVAKQILSRFLRGERTITIETADRIWEALKPRRKK